MCILSGGCNNCALYPKTGRAVKLYKKAPMDGPHWLAAMDFVRAVHLLIVAAHSESFDAGPITNPKYFAHGTI